MDDILEILSKDARRTPQEIAKLVSKSVESVKKTIKEYEENGVILQYKTVINKELLENGKNSVRALIEVGIMPQKDLGFDSIAERIFNFPEVKSCYLVSGGYDLLVVVEGDSIQMVAEFVASKLSPMPNVRQTATHFLLKTYKEDGQIFKKSIKHKRLNISP
jgi:DNA-binding Lrp family transcriptional regulator